MTSNSPHLLGCALLTLLSLGCRNLDNTLEVQAQTPSPLADTGAGSESGPETYTPPSGEEPLSEESDPEPEKSDPETETDPTADEALCEAACEAWVGCAVNEWTMDDCTDTCLSSMDDETRTVTECIIDAETCEGVLDCAYGSPNPDQPAPGGESSVEICDGEDNDGDGTADEDYPDYDGDGIADCVDDDHTVTLELTVDDAMHLWLDGDLVVEDSTGWSQVKSYTWQLSSGYHVVAVEGWDTGSVIAGLISRLTIDGQISHVSGDGSWLMLPTDAYDGWTLIDQPEQDEDGWRAPTPCTNTDPWISFDHDMMDTGAQWVWYMDDGNCSSDDAYGSALFRLVFQVP